MPSPLPKHRRRLLAPLLGAILLVGPGSASVPAASAANACADWGDVPPNRLTVGQARKATRCFINAERRQRGLHKLKANPILATAAQRHNQLMLQTGCFAHVCPREPALEIRLQQAGYLIDGLVNWGYAENIGWGTGETATARRVVTEWMASPLHRGNILDPDFREIGVGFGPGTPASPTAPGGVYTADFGFRKRP